MNSEYFGDAQIDKKKASNYRLLGNSSSMTPRNKKINEFEFIPKQNDYFQKSSLGYQSSMGSFREKRRSLLSLDSKENQFISDLQDLKTVKPKIQQSGKLSHLSVMNRTPQQSAKNRNKNGSTNNLNQSQSQNENDSDSVLNMSYIRRQIGLIKDFGKNSSFNQKDGDFTQTNRSRISKNEQTRKDINKIFQQLTDVYDKDSINKTIQKVKDPKEREKIIDRIIKRREEIKDAEQIVQISRCAQLINRFFKKVRKNEDGNPNITNNINVFSQNNVESSDKLSSNNTNDNLTFTTMNQKLQSNGLFPLLEARESVDNDAIDAKQNKQDTISNLQSSQVSPKNHENLLNVNQNKADIVTKGIALSAFMKQKDGFQKLLSMKTKETPSPQIDDPNSAAQASLQNDGSGSLSRAGSYIRRDSRRLSLVTKDNFFKNQLPANILPGSTDAKLYQINLNSITEKSKLLVEKGQESSRSKANQLLKDFQKLNLASHFKSKSLNQTNFNNSDVNTFNFQRVIHKKQAEAKISSLTSKQKEQMKALNQFLTYEEPTEVLNEIKEDVANYLSKCNNQARSQETIDFFMPGQLFKFNEVSKIDRGAHQKLKDIELKKKLQLVNLTKHSGGSSIHHLTPLTSRYEKDTLKEENTQFSSCNNLDNHQPHAKSLFRESSNNTQSSFNQMLSSTTHNTIIKQNTKPYFFDLKSDPQSQLDKHIQQQFEVKKNNYKPSPSIKEKSSYQKNPLANILQDQAKDGKNKEIQFAMSSKQGSYDKSIEKTDHTNNSLNYTSTLPPGNRKSFHLNKIFSYKNDGKTSRDQSKKSKDDSFKIKYSKYGEENGDLFHDTKELNHSLSFASFTEIRLDQLYKQTGRIKNQITQIDTSQYQNNKLNIYQPEIDKKMDQQLDKNMKDLKRTSKEIRETNSRKFKK